MINPLQRYPIEPLREATLAQQPIDNHYIAVKDARGYWHHLKYEKTDHATAIAIVHAINERVKTHGL